MQFYMKEVAKMLKKVSLMVVALLAVAPLANADFVYDVGEHVH